MDDLNIKLEKDTAWNILRGVAAERPADVAELAKAAMVDRVYDIVANRREELAKTIFRKPEVQPEPVPEPQADPEPEPTDNQE